MAGEAYLGWPQNHIKDFLSDTTVKRVLFIPYAGVNLSNEGLDASWDIYESKVKEVYTKLGYELYSIHKENDPITAVRNAEAIAVGGGNTFFLVHMMHKIGIMDAIKEVVQNGTAYMGWSAGSNVACPSLRTTNDMPIMEPVSFDCTGLIPFQINPHYLDAHPEGHGGETRQQRIEEFMAVNQDMYVVGLREASLLRMKGTKMELIGKHPLRIFKYGQEAYEVQPGESLDFLFNFI
jgi:dipeptidase E